MADPTLSSRRDYPTLARERAKRRAASQPTAPGNSSTRPYARARVNRYASFAEVPSEPATWSPAASSAPTRRHGGRHRARGTGRVSRHVHADTGAFEPLPISLRDEFTRVREGQEQTRPRRRNALRRSNRPVRAALLSVGAVLLLIVGIVVGPVIYRGTQAYQDIFEEPVPHSDSPYVAAINPEGTSVIVTATAASEASFPTWDGKERLTILLLGVDRREDEPSRSDTMILVNFDPVTKRAAMISIPRDMKVIVPGYGVHKINAAYAFGDADRVPGGGPGLTIRTIEANFGIPVHHYAQVDFQGFVEIVDTIGGVIVDVPYPIKDDLYPGPGNQYMRIYFQAGWQHMDGTRVLQYARTRHDDGDTRRSARQQQVLLALRAQSVSLDLISKAPELLAEVGDAVRTDLQPSQALQLARLASEIDAANIVQYSFDLALTEEQLPGQPYYLIANWSEVGLILSEFAGQTVLPPMSALANPNYDIEILIEDGTFNPGLGARVKGVLNANGFHNVTVVDKPDLGNYPTSTITADVANLTTAYLAAGVLGIDLLAINVSDDSSPSSTVASIGQFASPTPSITQSDGSASPSDRNNVDAVALFPTPTSGATSSSARTTSRLVIVIGDDAPDPAYFTAEPFTDDPVIEDFSPTDSESIEGGDSATGGIYQEDPVEE